MDRTDYVNQAEGRNQQDLYIHSGNVSVDRDTMTKGLRELFPERYQRIDAIKSGRTEQEDGSGRTEREKWTGAMEWEGGKEGRK